MSIWTLLVVEADADDERLTLHALGSVNEQLVVRIARDGQKALTALGLLEQKASHKNRMPDLVLLDLQLREIDGLEVLRQMRQNPRTEGLKVVALTRSGEYGDVDRAMELGAVRCLRKPAKYSEYLSTVSNAVCESLLHTGFEPGQPGAFIA